MWRGGPDLVGAVPEPPATLGGALVPRARAASSPSPCVLPLQLDHIDPRAVQLATLLVRGLTTLVLVNGACGSPWEMADFMPWHLFDGKLFHQKYLQSEKGYTAEVLVEQNVSPQSSSH